MKPKQTRTAHLFAANGALLHVVMVPDVLPQIIRMVDRRYFVLDQAGVGEGGIVHYTQTPVFDLPTSKR